MTEMLVAIIEDNIKVRQGLSQILELQGYKSKLFDNAEEFLQLADPDQFCAILLDQNLGEEQMTGLQLLKRFHQKNIVTPVLMMSGEATIDIGFAANQLGVFRCLPKPVGFEALGRALEEMRSEQENRRLKKGAGVTDQEREGLTAQFAVKDDRRVQAILHVGQVPLQRRPGDAQLFLQLQARHEFPPGQNLIDLVNAFHAAHACSPL